MITVETLEQFTTETRSLVSSSCVVLFELLNNQPINIAAIESVADYINSRGVTPQVVSWYDMTHINYKPLKQTITDNLSDDQADQVSNMFKFDHTYWSTYELTGKPTIDKLNDHKISYRLADQIASATVDGSFYNKTHEAISIAAASCMIDQTKDVFEAFHDETLQSRIEKSFEQTQSTHLLDILNNSSSVYMCESSTTCEETTRTDGIGDDTSEETAVDTFSTGSAREPREQTTHFKSVEPWHQHLNTTTSLDNVYISTNLIESAASSLNHARLGSIFDQTQTSSDYTRDITQLFMDETVSSLDKPLDIAQQTNKHNDFIQSQLEENVSAIKNDDDQITTEDIQDVS